MLLSAEEVGMLEFSVVLLGLHQAALLNVNYFAEAICRKKKTTQFWLRHIIKLLEIREIYIGKFQKQKIQADF